MQKAPSSDTATTSENAQWRTMAIVGATKADPDLKLAVSPLRDHIRGPLLAPASLVEYGDYESSACAAVHPIIEEIEEQMAEDLQFVFRHFPSSLFHPHSELAAEAAEAAGVHGKFWDVHHMLLKHQDLAALAEYADSAGLDTVRFLDDLASHAYAGKVAEDFASGVRSGVVAAPGFFINGRLYPGALDFPTLFGTLRNAANAAKRHEDCS
jgi:protein-disulfide isomerase